MITDCDRFWWKLNKLSIIILFCSIPVAVLFPMLSLVMPTSILFMVCDKFFVFHNIGEKQDDSLRFIISMPFSRRQVFDTYLKGLELTSISYFIANGLIRLVLTLLKFSLVHYWNSKINNSYDLITYMAIFSTCLLSANLLLVYLINNYTASKRSLNLSLSFIIVSILPIVLGYFEHILIFVTGVIKMFLNGSYKSEEITIIGISDKAAEILSTIIYLTVIGLLIWWLIFLINRERMRFTKVVWK